MNPWYEWRDAPPAQYAVIGDPVSHSLSPRMHRAAYVDLGIAATYTAVRVPEAEFVDALNRLGAVGYLGLNVTVPLKHAAYCWVKSVPPEVHEIEVVNTLRLSDTSGINTDVLGMRDVLDELSRIGQGDRTALVLGAGGSARAVMSGLSHGGYTVCAWNRSRTRLDEALEHFTHRIDVRTEPDPAGCQFIVNATSASMNGESIPIDWSCADKSAIAIDLYYTKGKTKFQQDAESHGLRSIDGRKLLVAQGARSFEWWTGVPAPREAMLRAIDED